MPNETPAAPPAGAEDLEGLDDLLFMLQVQSLAFTGIVDFLLTLAHVSHPAEYAAYLRETQSQVQAAKPDTLDRAVFEARLRKLAAANAGLEKSGGELRH